MRALVFSSPLKLPSARDSCAGSVAAAAFAEDGAEAGGVAEVVEVDEATARASSRLDAESANDGALLEMPSLACCT